MLSRARHVEFAIDPHRVLRLLLIVTAVLVVLSTAGKVAKYYLPDFPLRDNISNLLNVNGEQNLPTFYSSLMLLVAALLCGLIARSHSQSATYVRPWAALSVAFVLVSFDEFVSIHEQAGETLRDQLGITGGPLFYSWVIPGAALVALLGIALLRFLRSLPRTTLRRLWAAGVLFLSGAIGLEMVGGAYAAVHGEHNMSYVLIAAVEETLEMVGAAVLLYALLAYIPVVSPDVDYRVRVTAVD
jgi:hypothetical protein